MNKDGTLSQYTQEKIDKKPSNQKSDKKPSNEKSVIKPPVSTKKIEEKKSKAPPGFRIRWERLSS